jgi:hypothetical protein
MKNKMLQFFILLLGLIFLTQCIDTPKEVVAPKWDVEINLPVKKDRFTLAEIIDSSNNANIGILDSLGFQDGTSITGDSLYFLFVQDLEANSTIQDTLRIPISLAPDTLDLSGSTNGGEITNAIIYNPDPDYHLIEAQFRSGSFDIRLVNSSAFQIEYEIIVPGFKRKSDGALMQDIGTIAANTSSSISFPLADYNYKELPVAGINDLFNYTVQASEGFFFVGKVRASGSVNVDFISEINNDDITLSKLVGRIKTTELAYFEENYETGFGNDIKNFEESISFRDTRLAIRARTSGEMKNLKIVMDSLTVVGFDKSGNQILPINFDGKNYFRDSLTAGVQYYNVFNQDNTNLNDFFLKLPDVIRVGNKFILKKGDEAEENQTISDSDSIHFRANLFAPLIVSMLNATYADTVTLFDSFGEDGIFSDDAKKELNKGNSAKLSLDITNMIALGMTVITQIVDQNYNQLFSLKNASGQSSLVIPSANVNDDGVPISPGLSDGLALQLTKEEINLLLDQGKYVIISVAFNSTGSSGNTFGPYARVRAKDYIDYRLYGQVNYRVDPDSEN